MWIAVSLVVFSLLSLCGCQASGNVSSLTHLIYHREPVSWGRAHQMCESAGGRLVKVDTLVKTRMVNNAVAAANVTQGHHGGQLMLDYWLGLELHYRWADRELMANDWTRWAAPIPEPLICADLCVTTDLNGIWRQENCASRKPFICEFPTEHNCIFTVYRGKSIVDSVVYAYDGVALDHSSAFTQNGTQAFCEEKCLSYKAEGEECWVWTYIQGSCVFYKSASPLLPNLETLNKPNQTAKLTVDFFFKECYSVTVTSAPTDSWTTTDWESSGTLTSQGNAQDPSPATFKSASTPNGEASPSTVVRLEAFVTETTDSSAKRTPSGFEPLTTTDNSPVRLDLNSGLVSTVTSKHCECPVTLSNKVSQPLDTTPATPSEMTTDQSWPPPRKSTTVADIFEKLKLNVTNTSAYRRRHTSAPDDRPSARSVGYVGVACLCAFIVIIVCFDLEYFIHDIISIFYRRQ